MSLTERTPRVTQPAVPPDPSDGELKRQCGFRLPQPATDQPPSGGTAIYADGFGQPASCSALSGAFPPGTWTNLWASTVAPSKTPVWAAM